MTDKTILAVRPLGFPWETDDPFLFCVHHDDAYPAGNERMGPQASLEGRNLGMDFEIKDGWRMYHGEVVPGFPQHPHRGFETITLARRGFIDHSDSLGATARFGRGDAQWMTAGRGIVHAEMFPLIDRKAGNRCELFQIWLNLPRASKMVEPHFSMLWDTLIPKVPIADKAGKKTLVTLVAGRLGDVKAPPPPPKSWAAQIESDVAVWTLKMDPSAHFTLPPARAGTNRNLYYFKGGSLQIAGRKFDPGVAIRVASQAEIVLVNGSTEAELLMLQGRPIGEPVVQRGPFVMNDQREIMQAFVDYQQTGFGGWPWPTHDPVHPREQGRFARHADGRMDKPRA